MSENYAYRNTSDVVVVIVAKAHDPDSPVLQKWEVKPGDELKLRVHRNHRIEVVEQS